MKRVARTVAAQEVQVEFDQLLVEHLALVGYDPEFGARMLKRTIRFEVEAKLAEAMLKGEVSPGDRIMMTYDKAKKEVRIEKQAPQKAAPEKAAAQPKPKQAA